MTIDPIERLNLTFTAGAVSASFVFATPGFALSLALGGLLEAVSFRGLRHSALALFAGDAAPRRFGMTGFSSRFVLIAVAIGAALYAGAHPIGLLVGLSLIVPAALVGTWRERPRTWLLPDGIATFDWLPQEVLVLEGSGDYEALVAVLRLTDLSDFRGFIIDARWMPPPPENASAK